MTEKRLPSRGALVWIEGRRLVRDAKTLVSPATIFLVPLVNQDLGLALMSIALLFLPLVVGWSWGGDLESGNLVPLTLARNSRTNFFALRIGFFFAISILGFLPAAFLSVEGLRDRALVVLAVFDILAVGFFLVTLLRTSHAGWVPGLLAIVGIVVPLLAIGSKHLREPLPLPVRLFAVILTPLSASDVGGVSRSVVPWGVLGSGILFTVGTVLLLNRPSAIDVRR